MWKVAFRNLLRNRRRSLGTGLAITAGFVGLILLGAYIIRIHLMLKYHAIYMQQHGHIQIFKKGGLDGFSLQAKKFILPKESIDQVRHALEPLSDQIEFVGGSLTGSGLISNGERSMPFVASGVDVELEEKLLKNENVLVWNQDFLSGNNSQVDSLWKTEKASVAATPLLLEMLNRKPLLSTLSLTQREFELAARGLSSDLNAVSVKLNKIFTTGVYFLEDTSIQLPMEQLQELLQTDGLQSINIFLKESANPSKIIDLLSSKLALSSQLDFYLFDDEKISPLYVGTMGFLKTMAGFFIFLICTTVALTISNALSMGIIERTKELGMLNALGFNRSSIVLLLLRESTLLSLASLAFGGVSAMGIAFVVNHLNIKFHPPGLSQDLHFILAPTWWWVLIVVLLLYGVVAICTVFTSQVKLNVKPIDLLTDANS